MTQKPPHLIAISHFINRLVCPISLTPLIYHPATAELISSSETSLLGAVVELDFTMSSEVILIVSNDQRRVVTPKQAYKNGSDWLVIGRPITKGNIKKNIQNLIDHLSQ